MRKKKPTIDVKTSDLYREIASRSGFTATEARTVMELARDIVYEHLKNFEAIQLFRGLTIYVEYMPPRRFGANFANQAGKEILTLPKNVVKIHTGNYLYKLVNPTEEEALNIEDEGEDEYEL